MPRRRAHPRREPSASRPYVGRAAPRDARAAGPAGSLRRRRDGCALRARPSAQAAPHAHRCAGIPAADIDREVAWQHLVAGVRQLHERITPLGARIAFEPEPGMLVNSLGDWERLRDAVSLPDFGLALDVGHVPCTESISAGDAIRRYAGSIRTAHLDDSRNGVHEHLQIGDGSLDWPDIMRALREIHFTGIASVELSRHSHAAPEAARLAIERLNAALPN
ncbi:MAG: sugar phosphate isomerase/epimerase [Gemmatimonadetes bacterium]|nr:sugar phosphate isomerase/epimerase [Gemmatimonadota bacterium]